MKKPLLHHLHDYFFPHPRNDHHPHLFSAVSVAALIVAIVIFEAGYLVQTKFVFLKTDFLATVLPGALLALTNEDRTAYGLQEVTENTLLNQAAQAAAEDMALKGYFAHVSPEGKSPWHWLNEVGYRYSYAGENLAVNFTDSKNVQTAWMASPTHRANIIKPQYTEVGFGTANGLYEGKETTFVVEFFAAPVSPVRVPAAVTVAPSPSVQAPSTPSVQVLGSETSIPIALAAGPASPAKGNWLASLFSSPLYAFLISMSALLVLVATSFTAAVLVRGTLQHRSVLLGGVLLFLFVAGAMISSVWFSGRIELPANGQAASVYLVAP